MQIEEKYLEKLQDQKFLLVEDMEDYVKGIFSAYDVYAEKGTLYVILQKGTKEELKLNYSFYDKNYHLEV